MELASSLSGFAIDEAYGLTETGLVAVSPPAQIKLGSIGQVVPGVSLSIRDEDGAVVERGRDGRVWIKTGAACVGYWGDEEATSSAFIDGWLDPQSFYERCPFLTLVNTASRSSQVNIEMC